MERRKFEFDGETYLEGEFVLLNGYVDVCGGIEYNTEYLFNEQAYILSVCEDKAYLTRRWHSMDQYITTGLHIDTNDIVIGAAYVVTEGVGKVSKASIYDHPPKGYVYLTEETEKYCKPNLKEEWIICIILMAVTAMFKPVFVWSITILIGFLVYRHFRIKKYREYMKKKK